LQANLGPLKKKNWHIRLVTGHGKGERGFAIVIVYKKRRGLHLRKKLPRIGQLKKEPANADSDYATLPFTKPSVKPEEPWRDTQSAYVSGWYNRIDFQEFDAPLNAGADTTNQDTSGDICRGIRTARQNFPKQT
jgi:hypothetical protein